MTPEDKLAILLRAAPAPATSVGFESAVMARIARRRAWATVAASVPWTIAAVILCWALQPVLAPMSDALAPLMVQLGMIVTLLLLGAVLARGTRQLATITRWAGRRV